MKRIAIFKKEHYIALTLFIAIIFFCLHTVVINAESDDKTPISSLSFQYNTTGEYANHVDETNPYGINLVVTDGNYTLICGIDYTVTGNTFNWPATKAELTITGINKYYGTYNIEVTIVPKNIEKFNVEGIHDFQYVHEYDRKYNDRYQRYGYTFDPEYLTIGDGNSSYKPYYSNDCFDIKYEDNKTPGIAKIHIIGKNNYTGTITKTFKIIAIRINNCGSGGSNAAVTYTGSKIKPQFALSYKGQRIQEGIDYTVSYSDNVNVGIGTITYTGKGKFRGTKTVKFRIVPKTTPITSLTTKNKSITVAWTPLKLKMKTSYIDGYQIQYSTSKDFSSNTKKIYVNKYSSKTYTIKKLAKNKRYYIQIRTYKTIGSKKYMSNWSKTKSIVVK